MKRKPSENKTTNFAKKQKQASQEVELGQNQQGVAVPTEAVELASTDAVRFVQAGDAHFKLGKYPEAIASYIKATELEPTNAKFFHDLGDAYFNSDLDLEEEAIASYIKATELEPTNAKFFHDLGNAYYYLERGEEAIAPYIKATELEPTNAKFFHDLGDAYFSSDLGLDEEAIASHIKATELEPTNAKFFHDLGNAYYYLERGEEAIAPYIKATELEPTNAKFFNALGGAYYYLERGKEAIVFYIKATKLEPTNVSYFKSLGHAYFDLGEYPQAFKAYLKAMEVAEDDREKARCSNEIGDAITKLTEYTHIDKFKLTQLAMKYYGKGGEWGKKMIFDSIMSSKPLPEFMQISLMSHGGESPTKLAGLPALLDLGYSCFSKAEYTEALDAFNLFLKHEKQFDVFINAEVAAGEILELNQNVIMESILQTKSLKESINLRTNQDQHIRDFLSHIKNEYHLSATEFLPQVVNGLIRVFKHSYVSNLNILEIILSYIIDGETLESIKAPGKILKFFGESPTIEIEELTASKVLEIEVAGEGT